MMPDNGFANSSHKDRALTLEDAWIKVNDSVMGGVSESQIYVDEDVLHFEGKLSLANNGGFASLRRKLPEGFTHQSTGLCIDYKFSPQRQFQVRLRDGERFDGVAYQVVLTGNGQWQKANLAFDSFVPVYRGRLLAGVQGIPKTISAAQITQLGFLVGDKNTTPFTLQIKSITTC